MTETAGAKATSSTECRFRSGSWKPAIVAAVLALSLTKCSGAIAEETHPLDVVGIEIGSLRAQPKPVQVDQIMSSSINRGLSIPRSVPVADMTESGHKCSANPISTRTVDPANYEYGCREIEEMLSGNFTRVGNGGVRTVFLVEYGGRKLVVKTLNDIKRLGQHNREVATLNALRGQQNVVGMLGVCGTSVVTDFVAESFSNIILREGKDLPTRRLIRLAIDAAKGLQAVHDIAGGIHMDMRPSQLLITDTGRGMLNDFNSVHLMSVSPEDQQAFCPSAIRKSFSQRNPWRAPESLAGQPLTDKADIYSLGMVFYSLVAGKAPYDSSLERLELAHKNKARPEIDARWHQGFMEVVKDMWRESPEDRPPARQVVVRLQELLDQLDGDAPGDW